MRIGFDVAHDTGEKFRQTIPWGCRSRIVARLLSVVSDAAERHGHGQVEDMVFSKKLEELFQIDTKPKDA